jgi:hypothetical protein
MMYMNWPCHLLLKGPYFFWMIKSKRENINGLQLTDLIAYPIARFVIEPKRANPAFDLIETKIYAKDGEWSGLKIYP